MSGATLADNAPGSNTFVTLGGGASGSYISNSGQILRQNIAGNVYSDIAVPVYNLGKILVENSRLEFSSANATTHNVSIYQYAGSTQLVFNAHLDAASGYLQDGGSLQTNDTSHCYLETNTQVEIHGGGVVLDPVDNPPSFGTLHVTGGPLTFSGGTYNAKIQSGGIFEDQIIADTLSIVQGTSYLVVTAVGAVPVTGTTWNIITVTVTPIGRSDFANRTFPAGIDGYRRFPNSVPGYYQLYTRP